MSSNPDLSEFVKAYDVRGLVGSQLTDAVVSAIGAAFVDEVAAGLEQMGYVVTPLTSAALTPPILDAGALGIAWRERTSATGSWSDLRRSWMR